MSGNSFPGSKSSGMFSAWNMNELEKVPETWDAPGFRDGPIRGLFYEGLPWKGRPTRVFAWYGAPQEAATRKVPAVVLVHGGGSTAFSDWVRLWNERGYAALAMDTCGCTAGGEFQNRPRHEHGGPPGWGGFDQRDWLPEDQWCYHAVAAVVRGHSLLRSFPKISCERIGVYGKSWGGFLTCVASAIDARFRFAVPLYGCGCLDASFFVNDIRASGPEKAAFWMKTWDASAYLPNSSVPMLWVNGTNDYAFMPDCWQMSYRLPKTPRTLVMKIRLEHKQSVHPPEVYAYADAICLGSEPLPKIIRQGSDGRLAWADFESQRALRGAELCFTKDRGPWQERAWHSQPAAIVHGGSRVQADVPQDATVYYLNLVDARELTVSTEHVECPG